MPPAETPTEVWVGLTEVCGPAKVRLGIVAARAVEVSRDEILPAAERYRADREGS